MRRSLLFVFGLLAASEALAVSPLVVDDADTVERGRLQLNLVWRFTRDVSSRLYLVPINPVYGLTARGELGMAFGYLRRDANGDLLETSAGGAADVAFATKWKLWQSDGGFLLSGSVDVKLPAASERRGLGTGHTDVAGALVATRCWGPACLDWNAGYVAADVSRDVFADDTWFLGQAVRYEISERWTLLGEIYGLIPQGDEATDANLHFEVGAQLSLGEDFVMSALVGSAGGASSPDVTTYVGFTWTF